MRLGVALFGGLADPIRALFVVPFDLFSEQEMGADLQLRLRVPGLGPPEQAREVARRHGAAGEQERRRENGGGAAENGAAAFPAGGGGADGCREAVAESVPRVRRNGGNGPERGADRGCETGFGGGVVLHRCSFPKRGSRSARRSARARVRRNLAVPSGTPSAAAVSARENSSQ